MVGSLRLFGLSHEAWGAVSYSACEGRLGHLGSGQGSLTFAHLWNPVPL